MQAECTAYGVAPDNTPFSWGPIHQTHTIGDFAIVEYEARRASNAPDDWEPHRLFSLYVRDEVESTGWHSTGHSFHTLDDALLAGIAWKYEAKAGDWNVAANSQAWRYIRRMIGMGD